MLTKDQLISGIVSYITEEMLPSFDGWRLTVASIALNLAEANASPIVDQYLVHPALSALKVVNEDGLIDIDNVYQAFNKSKKRIKPITIDLANYGLGCKFTMKTEDIEKLYQYLQAQAAEQ